MPALVVSRFFVAFGIGLMVSSHGISDVSVYIATVEYTGLDRLQGDQEIECVLNIDCGLTAAESLLFFKLVEGIFNSCRFDKSKGRIRPTVRRICCFLWARGHYSRLYTTKKRGLTIRGRTLYLCCLLVYLINIFCKSHSDYRTHHD